MISIFIDCVLWVFMVIFKSNFGTCIDTETREVGISRTKKDQSVSYTIGEQCEQDNSKLLEQDNFENQEGSKRESRDSRYNDNAFRMEKDESSKTTIDRPKTSDTHHYQNGTNKTWRTENQKIPFQATVVVSNSQSKATQLEPAAKNSISKSNAQQDSLPLTTANVDDSETPTQIVSQWNRKRKADFTKKLSPLSWRLQLQLNFSEQEFAQFLERYIIDLNLLRSYGYPVVSTIHVGCVEFSTTLPKLNKSKIQQQTTQRTNLTNGNNGNCFMTSTNNNITEVNLNGTFTIDSVHSPQVENSLPDELVTKSASNTCNELNGKDMRQAIGNNSLEYNHTKQRQCVRCQCNFEVTETGEYLKRESCTFHWGKLYEVYTIDEGFIYQYTCCKGDCNSVGCVQNDLHVWTGAVDGLNGPFMDFVLTKPRHNKNQPVKVFALDCEMSFTVRGLEVTKITIISYDGSLVYEHFVRPDSEIVDYNTRFSGITEKDLSPESKNVIKTLDEVHIDLLELIDADTIIIGHGLDNDLRALRIAHSTIVDTSIVFPHAKGFPFRRGLKHLSKIYLRRDIQNSDAGHSCLEDSKASLDLMLWKMHKEWRYH